MSRRKLQDTDLTTLLRGIRFNVYQAKSYDNRPGTWHGHIAGIRRSDVDGARLPLATATAERIAHQVEQRRAEGENLDELLRDCPRDFPIHVSHGSEWWCDVGFCASEDEARERVCRVIGYIFGRRLARATAGYTPQPQPVPPVREGSF